jgi:ATP-dependent protease ClpP protease subunit
MTLFSLEAVAEGLNEEPVAPVAIIPDVDDPDNPQLPEEINIQAVDGDLVAVDDLDADDIIPEVIPPKVVAPVVAPSTENLSPEELAAAPIDKNSKAYLMHPENNQTPPLPAILGKSGGIIAYLYGRCNSTVAPLLHILATANEDDKICIEINSPYLGPSDLLSVATAIETSKAKVEVNLVCGRDITHLLLYCAADEGNLLDGAQIFAPIANYTHGSAEDMQFTVEQFNDYSNMVLDYLVEKKLLNEEELSNIKDKSEIFAISTRELKSRMGQ